MKVTRFFLILAVFWVLITFAKNLNINSVDIDGYKYDVKSESIRIFPKTEIFTDKINRFNNLKELTIIPFKYAIKVVSYDESIEGNKEKVKEIMDSYIEVDDLSCIEKFDRLEYLNIDHCAVDNADFLSEMTELKTLVISNTQITDISFVQNLKKLEVIDCCNCPITDYHSLLYCENLNRVYVEKDKLDNDISDKLSENGVSVIEE